jgi:hypothetical protein
VNGSPKGNKRQKKAAGYFDDLEDEVVVVHKQCSKGEALPEGKGRTKPQPKTCGGRWRIRGGRC